MRAAFLSPFVIAFSTLLASGCGPALAEQQGLARRSRLAADACKVDGKRCAAAKDCADRSVIASKAIQGAQEARAAGTNTAALEVSAAGSYAAADAACKAGGW